jgi:uncharacterized membrane protein HdeD (DUF308 family)
MPYVMATSPDATSSPDDFARWVWYSLVLFGLLTFAVGVFFIVDPDETLKVFTVILGIFLVIDGVLAMVAGVVGRGEGRGLLALLGVVSVIAGIVLIEEPFGALKVFVIIIGIWFILAGIVRFVYAFTVPEGKGGYIFVALIDAAAGILILGWPDIGLSTLGVIIGIVLVLRGALFTFTGWAALKLERSERSSGTPQQA